MQVFSDGQKIIINTLEENNIIEDRLFNGVKEVEIGENSISISRTILEEFSEQLPYSSVKEVLLIDLGNTPADKVSFELVCEGNQFFFAAEKRYLLLWNALNNNPEEYPQEHLDKVKNRLITKVRPKIQLLKHKVINEGHKANLTKSKVKYLLSYLEKETSEIKKLGEKFRNRENGFYNYLSLKISFL